MCCFCFLFISFFYFFLSYILLSSDVTSKSNRADAYDFPTAQGGQDMTMSTFSPVDLQSSNGMRMCVSQCMCLCVWTEWT